MSSSSTTSSSSSSNDYTRDTIINYGSEAAWLNNLKCIRASSDMMTYLLSLLLRLLQLVYNSTCIYYSYYGQVTYPPPQPSARARSLPVPRGRTATAGGGWKLSWSSTESTQPTVPSPPQASTRRLATLRNISNLVREKHHLNLSLSLSLPPKKK